jgi:cytochrome c oxidase subunit 3/cytochrome o ubiquinol oxidase subunit 3
MTTPPLSIPPGPETHGSGIDNTKMGVWAFISSETIFFSALIVAYIAMHNKNISGPSPAILNIPITSVNTFILICSSFTMVSALAAVQHDRLARGRNFLIATFFLGLAFLGGQAYEFSSLAREGLSLSKNMFGATFFTLTGFHGAHVAIGLVWILFIFARFRARRLSGANYTALEMAGLYWHFVDLVWIIIFTVVYLI